MAVIAVISRVAEASVTADGVPCGAIGAGLLLLLGVAQGDTGEDVRLLAEKISRLRIFCDGCGKMNRSVRDIDGEVLVVSNFTLLANYVHGNRPDFLAAAAPSVAEPLYEDFLDAMRGLVRYVAHGKFGADMKIASVSDGPVTIVMDSAKLRKKNV